MSNCGFIYMILSQAPDSSKSHISGGEYDSNQKIHLVFPCSEGNGFGHIPANLNNALIRQIYRENIARSVTSLGKNLELGEEDMKKLPDIIKADKYLDENLKDRVYHLEKHSISANPEGFYEEVRKLIQMEQADLRKKGYDTMIGNYIDKVAKGEIPAEDLLSRKQSM